MRTITTLLAIGMVLAWPNGYASIIDFKQLDIDFTSPVDAAAKATWSEPEKIMIAKEGLGWEGEAAASRDGWIQTTPLAIGLSWRPAQSISVRVAIQPPPREVQLDNGQKFTPYIGVVYARYSPDLRHWSSWQALDGGQPRPGEETAKPARRYHGTMQVPYRDRAEYGKLLSEYSELDVPWKSDEEAAVTWMLKRDPELFARRIPFIGYVEFLFEGPFSGGQRIQSLKVEISYGVSGLATMPRDAAVGQGRDVPWRFKAGADSKAKPEDAANANLPTGCGTNRTAAATRAGP